MVNNLENIPACLRVIARQIERGEIAADVGVLTLRKKGAARPTVFGFGAEGKLDPHGELSKAADELIKLGEKRQFVTTDMVRKARLVRMPVSTGH